ncbi:MAG TPA: helix-turn-helix domain-containing protein [Mycobacteriales bacterium]|nr:helix-turn-helix domain-containing protein [Mycobacteriales bacterium]
MTAPADCDLVNETRPFYVASLSAKRRHRTTATLGRRAAKGTVMALLTVEQAAERLGTSTRFVRRLTSEKRIPYVKLGGGSHVRIDEDDLEAFIAAGRIDPVPSTLF